MAKKRFYTEDEELENEFWGSVKRQKPKIHTTEPKPRPKPFKGLREARKINRIKNKLSN